MSFEIEGKLHKIFETESKTPTFQARDFVILVEDGNYPQYIKFQLTQERCSLIDNYKEGDKIKVYFDLRGREWKDKYFTNLNAWKIENAGEPVAPPQDEAPFPDEDDNPFDNEFEDHAGDIQDDLPF